jgi:hypothetical protein
MATVGILMARVLWLRRAANASAPSRILRSSHRLVVERAHRAQGWSGILRALRAGVDKAGKPPPPALDR